MDVSTTLATASRSPGAATLAPRLRAGSRDRVAAGTPVTVEPGVYLPGFGGVRIEDLVVARPGGHELLTTVPKELLEL